jgi:hypothetical protein
VRLRARDAVRTVMIRIALVIVIVTLATPAPARAEGRDWSRQQMQQAVIALCVGTNLPPKNALDFLKGNLANPFPALKLLSESKGRIALATYATGHPAAPRLTVASVGGMTLGLEVELKPGSFDRVRAAMGRMPRVTLEAQQAGRVLTGPYDSVWGRGQVTLVRDPGVLLKCTPQPASLPAAAAALVRELNNGRFADAAAGPEPPAGGEGTSTRRDAAATD